MTTPSATTDTMTGSIRKMRTTGGDPVQYVLPVGDDLFAIDQCIGKQLNLTHTGNIHCISCGRQTKKSFSQGYCFPCFKSLAECDMCIMRPETCHHHMGTCRDENWAERHCMQPHYVYLANSSGLKVGITRENQIPTRWFDQGATQAIPLFKVKNRYHSGLVEANLKKLISDRTDWRKMLKGNAEKKDLVQEATELLASAEESLNKLESETPDLSLQRCQDASVDIDFPVKVFPEKVTSFNFDKTPEVGGLLNGIKGQYLIFEGGVINLRKFSGYEIKVEAG